MSGVRAKSSDEEGDPVSVSTPNARSQQAVPLPPENIYAHTKKLRFILEHLERLRTERAGPVSILDFGCGNGSAVSQYLILDGVRYVGVDFHPDSIAYASKHFGGDAATFVDRIPEGVRFDVLVYADVLEHLDDPAAMLREHATRLAPDGILIGSVPNGYGAFENEKRLDRWLKIGAFLDLPARVRRNLGGKALEAAASEPLPYNAESGHVQFFTRSGLERVLAEAGFAIRDFRNGALIGAPLSERYVLRGERIARWNARAADWCPSWAAASWLFMAARVL
jgi:2-polyprenyl-3-methyl-5-hydroxy-6-metoxy-1,4-benzoquinol methylase